MSWPLAISAAALLSVAAAGFTYQRAGEKRDRRRFPAPGRTVTVRGAAIHMQIGGRGEPTVVFESGLAATSLSWSYVQPAVAKVTQTVTYDRPGLGWSAARRKSGALSLSDCAATLKDALDAVPVSPPYILVAHSFGALIIEAFAQLWPERVSGLVFVDPVSMTAWSRPSLQEARRLARGVRLSKRGAWLARFGVVRFALDVAQRRPSITRSIAQASTGSAMPFLARLVGDVRKLPPEMLPALCSHWTCAKSFTAMADHLRALPRFARAAQQMTVPANIPVIILSAETSSEGERDERDARLRSGLNVSHRVMPGSGHWIHLEQPRAVVQAVEELVGTVRASGSLNRFEPDLDPGRSQSA